VTALGAVLLLALLYLVTWRVHVHFYPWKPCPRCTRGRRYSGEAHADCSRCGATGRVRRFGAPRGERR
jgi:hypothetical protein